MVLKNSLMRISGIFTLILHKSNQNNFILLLFLTPILNNMNVAIGKQIKALRKNKGVSQEEVAEYLNISQSAYSRIENGNSHSWACYVEKICSYFEIKPNHLMDLIPLEKNREINGGGVNSYYSVF
jgi:DNA-binding XRE family transcriptional regulator